ncbi:hypothetical protein, partial [Aeromonas sp. EERV15]|uniref:hypothetical protein n=1 Tax=Aeromonas sp. EERV15 TaxID=1833892 RepID=UPI000A79AEDC
FEILRKEHELAVKLLWQFLGVLADRLDQTSRDLTTAREALAADPIRGGLYLASDPPGTQSPFRRAAERGRGPDPRTPHLVAAGLVAAGAMVFFGLSYIHQRAIWGTAADALQQYNPAAANRDRERALRRAIVAFTEEHTSWLDTHPDFFASRR